MMFAAILSFSPSNAKYSGVNGVMLNNGTQKSEMRRGKKSRNPDTSVLLARLHELLMLLAQPHEGACVRTQQMLNKHAMPKKNEIKQKRTRFSDAFELLVENGRVQAADDLPVRALAVVVLQHKLAHLVQGLQTTHRTREMTKIENEGQTTTQKQHNL